MRFKLILWLTIPLFLAFIVYKGPDLVDKGKKATELLSSLQVLILGIDVVDGIYFLDENTGWLLASHVRALSKAMPTLFYLETQDGGKTWKKTSDGRLFRKFRKGMYFINEKEGWHVKAGFGVFGTVYHTVDGGQHWERQRIPISGQFEAVQFVNERTGWVGGPGIYKTVNGGQTWEEKAAELNKNFDVRGICFLNEYVGWVCGNGFDRTSEKSGAIVLNTMDGGESWSIQLDWDVFAIHDIFFINERTGWILSDSDEVFRTIDGGKTWERLYAFDSHIWSVHFINEKVGWVLESRKPPVLFKTTDGGKTWIEE